MRVREACAESGERGEMIEETCDKSVGHTIDLTTGLCSLCGKKLRPSLIERVEILERQLSKDPIADSVLTHLYLTEVEDALVELLCETEPALRGDKGKVTLLVITLVDGLRKKGFRFRKVIS